jgi:hypothetical protein
MYVPKVFATLAVRENKPLAPLAQPTAVTEAD